MGTASCGVSLLSSGLAKLHVQQHQPESGHDQAAEDVTHTARRRKAWLEEGHEIHQKAIQIVKQRHDDALQGAGDEASVFERARRASVGSASVAQTDDDSDRWLPPEVAALGNRVTAAATGRVGGMPEQLFTSKEMVFARCSNVEELQDIYGVDFRCFAGESPDAARPNQDDFFIAHTTDNYSLFAVFDGHGADGHRIAALTRNALLRYLVHHIPHDAVSRQRADDQVMNAILQKAFAVAHDALITDDPDMPDARLSGAAAVVVVHDVPSRRLHVAGLGNCRALLGDSAFKKHKQFASAADLLLAQPSAGRGKMMIRSLNTDHTTEQPEERRRVEMAGADLRSGPGKTLREEIFLRGEQWPGIPLTRCVGNFLAQTVGVSREPEVVHIGMESPPPKYLILATDGVWDVISEKDVIKTLGDSDRDNLQFAMKQVIQQVMTEWSRRAERSGCVDDATIIVVNLHG